jgi:hypothetical protein
MKFSNDLQKEIVEYLLSDKRFFYLGFTGTHFISSWEKGDEDKGDFIALKKDHSAKSLAKVEICIYADNYGSKEVEFKIRLYLVSYYEWETFFEGWAENLDEFKMAMKMIGL